MRSFDAAVTFRKALRAAFSRERCMLGAQAAVRQADLGVGTGLGGCCVRTGQLESALWDDEWSVSGQRGVCGYRAELNGGAGR